ncbi:MAG: transglutaminase-like domain-containing protein [Candidatus Anstonellaceae archaeon]
MQRLILFVVFLSVCSQSALSPYLVTSATVNINESGTVIVHGGELRYMQLKIQIPRNSTYQQVLADHAIRTDEHGNAYMIIEEKNPKNPFLYSVGIEAKTKNRKVINLPEDFRLTAEELIYLSPTNRTQSNDSRIIALAKNITEGSADNFEKVAKLAIWVHQNIKYNESYVGKKSDAISVLNNKEGVCFEYSTLFAALARAAGIPTKYVSGYVYSEKYGTWLGHVWNEVYLGEWVSVDPTWLEVGAVDALHIETSKAHELTEENTLIANIYPQDAKLEWETSGKSGPIASNIKIITIEQEYPLSDYNVDVAAKRLPPKVSTVVFIEIQGNDYRVLPVTLASCTGIGSFEIDNRTRYLILRPNKKTIASWIIKAPADVQPGYYYTCPLTINSPYLEAKTITVKVDPRTNLRDFQASVSNENLKAGDDLLVSLNFSDSMRQYVIYTITDSQIMQKVLSPNKTTIIVPAVEPGNRTIILASENGGYAILPYYVSEAERELWLGEIEGTKLIVGKEGKISFDVEAKEYPKKVDIKLEYENNTVSETVEIYRPSKVEIPIYIENAGIIPFSIRLASEHNVLTRYGFLEAKLAPKVQVKSINMQKLGGDLYEVLVLVYKEGDVSSASVKIGDIEKNAENEMLRFVLKSGNYSLKIEWVDFEGNVYEDGLIVSIKKDEPKIPFCLSGAFAILIIIFIYTRRN